jgi:putative membrane protein (TIGR04086 family)
VIGPMKSVTQVRPSSPFFGGLFIAIIWLGAGALLLSMLLRFSSLQEGSLPALAMSVHGLAALAGGFSSGRRSARRGWYYGAVLGAVYALIILLIGFLAADAPLAWSTMSLLGVTTAAGAVGGMFGVGTRS